MIEQQKPRISVVTAAYNALDGLRTTIASVAEQDFDSVEHIVVDGASNDGTATYLEGLGDNVRWISEPDKGIGDAMNKGVAMARGDYVLVLHAEDYFASEQSLTEVAKYLDGTDIVSFDVMITDEGAERIFPTRGFGLKAEFFATVPHQGAFCRRDLFDWIGDFDQQYRIAMDYEWMLRAKRAGASIKQINRHVTVMPATGISAQLDWPSLEKRLAENRLVQDRMGNSLLAPIRDAFWVAYPVYKRWRVGG
ncbi:glycosyltransferase family 2 protein [Altererythrobacter sp. ZODW24]|uniref:glycosyltransferase family 2 protein n=1 Tax=Altererythrobacter sp. ZODW24 TaxID=2185142 RepID=UPI0013B420F5|nr:glycosyltransferase family 2 protein [Altererythrobacter sp. ZODW24]